LSPSNYYQLPGLRENLYSCQFKENSKLETFLIL